MRFAYADPPYYGCGKLYKHLHDEADVWDSQQAHLDLVARLQADYPDGWALSCNPKDLSWLLPACSPDARVCAWVKTFHQVHWYVSVQYAWEPVIVEGGRKLQKRNPWVRDWTTGAVTKRTGTPGAKPDYFNRWVLLLLGYQQGDTLDDLFPGSNSMKRTLEQGVMI